MMKEIYLAGGCFWGVERFFKLLEGVTSTEVGYANGDSALDGVSYEQVRTGTTGYAETVHVTYDPAVIGLDTLLAMYFLAIDPVSVNRQGEDEGPQYRTGIYYTDAADLETIDAKMAENAALHYEPLAVEVAPLSVFHRAEEYHQDYLEKNPNGYCHLPLGLFELARRTRSK